MKRSLIALVGAVALSACAGTSRHSEASEQAVMNWFHGWQSADNSIDIAGSFDENLRFEAPDYTFTSRDQLVEFSRSSPNPWHEVRLLASYYEADKAAILYEGRNEAGRMRVAEFYKLRDGRITEVRVVYSNMPDE